MGAGGDGDKDAALDARYEWLETWVSLKLSVKPEKFKKLLTTDTAASINAFVNNPDCRRLFISGKDKENKELLCGDLPPAPLKRRAVYFVKLQKQPLTPENMDAMVMPGDLLPDTLQQLHTVCEAAYLPLVANPASSPGWPQPVLAEVANGLSRLSALIYVTLGQAQGRTLLPLPAEPSGGGGAAGNEKRMAEALVARDKERVHAFEAAVVTWMKQIKTTLKGDPEGSTENKDGLIVSHPGPLHELAFWRSRSANLASIQAQLKGERVRRVVRVLELTQSNYCQTFSRLQDDVNEASDEAADTLKFLSAMREDLDALESCTPDAFTELPSRFQGTMHLALLVWTHSQYYNIPSRLAVLLRQMCNALIERAREFVDPEALFSLEPAEALERLHGALEVCASFKAAYFVAKEASNTMAPDNPWKFQNGVIFARLDQFLERCHDLHEFAQTVVQFQKLERIELGGSKGRTLSASIAQMHSDFSAALDTFQKIQYDVLDIASKAFDDDFYAFRTQIKQLERRLATVLGQAYEDCHTVVMSFKLIDAFEGLLERDSLRSDLLTKQAEIVSDYSADLRDVSQLFHHEKQRSAEGFYLERDGPPLYTNMPPVAGALFWVHGLIERVSGPMAKLKSGMERILEAEDSKEMLSLHEGLLKLLRSFETKAFSEWASSVEDTSAAKLRQPLLVREEATRLLSVNFDPDLVRLLREVRYLSYVTSREVPPAAAELNQQAESFRVLIGNLQLIVGKYNQMLLTLMEVEKPLLERELKSMDGLLEQGLTHLTWKSVEVKDFVKQALNEVSAAFAKLAFIKENLREIVEIVDKWKKSPLIKRKAATYTPEEFAEPQKTFLTSRYQEVADGGKAIHRLLLESNKELKVSKGALPWKAYVEYVSDLVADGLSTLVCTSLGFVTSQIDVEAISKNEITPWLEVQIELMPPNVSFSPRLAMDAALDPPPTQKLSAGSAPLSIGATVLRWVADFFHVGKLVKRLDRADGDFLSELHEREEVRYYVHEVMRHTRQSFGDAEALLAPFAAYKKLWTADVAAELQGFLAANARNAEVAEWRGDGESPGAGGVGGGSGRESPTRGAGGGSSSSGGHQSEAAREAALTFRRMRAEPELSSFEAMIAEKKAKADEVASMPVAINCGWLKCDTKPAKQALSTWVTKWMFAYTQHLRDNVVESVESLEAFMADVQAGLDSAGDAALGDDELIAAMTHIHAVDDADPLVDELFEPLRGSVLLLKRYGITLGDETIAALEHAPYAWEDTRKLAAAASESLAPQKQAQGQKILQEAEAFTAEVASFRGDFKAHAPFDYEIGTEDSYTQIDLWVKRLDETESLASSLRDREHLFDVRVHPWKELATCRAELLQLKLIWDHAALVESIFSAWEATPWAQVDCDGCYTQAKRLQAQVVALEKRVRLAPSWGVYTGTLTALSDMLVTLPLVQDLRDEAMRDRHWKKLMRICGKSFVMDDKFALRDLLQLKLYNFADAVGDIVEQSRQELKIDKQLTKIETVWLNLILEYSQFKATGVNVLVEASLGPVIEALDEHEAALQAISGNRFVAFFENAVTSWRVKLGGVRSTLDAWVEVQRQWCSLESIFLASEDIREQLPDDAKRFDGIDASFKEQMADASQTLSPVDACMKDGRMEALTQCQTGLELCSRSLADYLETKRKKFPRFYFISSADLIDILSKGRSPPAVQEHFSKFTDNVGGITWEVDEESGQQVGVALGMKSGEGETVTFPSSLLCEGPVEDWLNELMAHVCDSLRRRLEECLNLYVELPREKFLMDASAQHAITTSQVWWTTEVDGAFEKLEGGNENAVKEYVSQISLGLEGLSRMVLGELTKDARAKIKTIITIEVHARDAVQKLVLDKVDSAQSFAWQSQLKYRWDDEQHDCFINICDAEFRYSYEYTGNCGRLVITALTDRCYITLTQALRLVLGGAPAGPAGTGKTETTKDLGRGLAIWVVVMNCSDQMTAKSMANIFMGLAQTGAWGCFDEFNRIPVEVLSVTATQYGAVLNAIAARKEKFIFDEEEITLTPSVGAFITMNPGYAGRTELPENLKALFRGCAMVTPDFEAIIEIELSAEGFIEAKILAHKFITLFLLSKELLSKQMHYDWGLRAIKGILRIAGGMKRGEPDKKEIQILMRALRDVNLPKFVEADFGIFLGLINDLFPKVDAPKVTDATLTQALVDVLNDPECPLVRDDADVFVSKAVSLAELFSVRHCVFVLGAAGSSKSEVWGTLAKAQTNISKDGGKTIPMSLNPKAVTSNELYGYINPTTKELNDGVIAKIMRDFSKSESPGQKWVVLDGDIDAEWIESMNTVMDDNKVLTLVSNERIPLTPAMRLLLEVSHMRNASPATASRGGVLFLNETDVGWAPLLHSWIDRKAAERSKQDKDKVYQYLTQLCEQYVSVTLGYVRKQKLVTITPIMDIAMVEMLTRILDGMLTLDNCPPGAEKDLYEAYFQFAAVWAFGGALAADKVSDHRKAFSEWWRAEWGKASVKWPEGGLVFDYFVSPNSGGELGHWRERIEGYTHTPSADFASIVVPTMETTRLGFFLDTLLPMGAPCMLVGNAGTAKTTVLADKLRSLPDNMLSYTINFNSFSNAAALQPILEQPLEKKSGTTFGPPGSKRLVYLLDDLNMPTPDKYGTQSAIALLRQQYDYGGFYDLKKLAFKSIVNVLYMGAMNPTAGSFYIIDRMQRHFCTFACLFPEAEVLATIYGSILNGHLQQFAPEVGSLGDVCVTATLKLHKEVADAFLPTAVKFHYQWNLRELASVFQGLTLSTPEYYTNGLHLARLWRHEVYRVYSDRLVDDVDLDKFAEIANRVTKSCFEELEQDELQALPLVFSNFAIGAQTEEKVYFGFDSYEKLKRVLEGKLGEYNDSNARMDLVLFEQAMEHICRISRIIDNPRGNAMLVGVGGSGKQSLTRLAAFISGYTVFSVKLTSTYSMGDFKADVLALYQKAGVKGEGLVWLFTDQQLLHERMLVYFNDILSVGLPPDLFNQEDKDNAINAIRSEVKSAGIMDTADNCWEFFVNKVRTNLHIVLCMSPVGAGFRVRCRKFPALTNCTSLDWFTAWPEEALISVAQRFLEEVEFDDAEIGENVAHHMAFVHQSVGGIAAEYLAQERRNVYTTPKSYLELIALYKKLLAKQRAGLDAMKARLATGLVKLRSSAEQVAEMQVKLKDEQVVVEQKKAETDALLVQVGKESAIAEEQAEYAAVEEEKVAIVQKEVGAFATQCAADLAAAEPAIKKAEAALGGLDKGSLGELKGLSSPPAAVLAVTAAVTYMLAPKGSNLKKLDLSWGGAKKMMADPGKFLEKLQQFDKDNFWMDAKEYVLKYTGTATITGTTGTKVVTQGFAGTSENPEFNYEYMKSKSGAAAGLCDWIVNICIYHDIYLDVEPKRKLLEEAEGKLADANRKLQTVRDTVAALEARKAELQGQLMEATDEKNRLLEAAAATAKRLNLAERLVNGLKDENERWGAGVSALGEQMSLLPGDVMVSASFIAYIGPFNEGFRMQMRTTWFDDLVGRSIPCSESVDPIGMLADDAAIAEWQREGLPADRLSVENGAILNNATRWPLIVDPQLQGITWLKQREAENNVQICQLSQKNFLDKFQYAMTEGLPLLLENLGETVEAVLEPVISRAIIAKGRKLIIKLGDTEVDLLTAKDAETGESSNVPLFRLYMQTKLPNPHYIPELQAQTTLVNFTVTEKGLEDQLLARCVNNERPDLEEQRMELVQQQNEFTIRLKQLEDDLLERLANAEGDILADEELIISLEVTKATVAEINEKKAVATKTTKMVEEARESYRVVGTRGSLMFFLIDQLSVIDHMYQYSLAAFTFFFQKALNKAPAAESLGARCESLLDSVTFGLFAYVTRGLFERHRLIFSLQLACRMLVQAKQLDTSLVEHLVRGPKVVAPNPLNTWLADGAWQSVVALSSLEAFGPLPNDMEGSAKRWKEWYDHQQPEAEVLPGDWKRLAPFERLLVIRALRPDRTTLAVAMWVREVLGTKYGEAVPFDLPLSFEDASAATPVFFLLSAGVAVPLEQLRSMGDPLGKTEDHGKFVVVSLGQGQEPVAEKALDAMANIGGWALLQNVELVARWLPKLEKKLEGLIEGAHEDFRVFLSALPQKVVPVGVLQNSIKLTNEPPTGLKANMLRAYGSFTDAIWENSAKPAELKSMTFALCFFHSVVCERRKFSPIGWNRGYPFNPGDLSVCITVANNYLEANPKIPWTDLRYIFGEIMYGGHITDAKDRRLCNAYLLSYVHEELLDQLEFFPRFPVPPNSFSHKQYCEYIEEKLAVETPTAYGLHPNSEIGFMTRQCDALFAAVAELQPRGGGGGGGMSTAERVKRMLDEIVEKLPDLFPMGELEERTAEERSPYVGVFLQECERMNGLLFELKRSLSELDMGLKGDLSITEAMEALMNALYDDKVPDAWAQRAYPSLRTLGPWLSNLLERQKQLEGWTADLATPKVTWLSGLFNPQAFLTAVMQVTARKNEWPLDKLVTVVEVSKKAAEEIEPGGARDGAYVSGLYVEGARWDAQAGVLEDAHMKDLYPKLPLIVIKATTASKDEARDIYACPVYQTADRGPTFVFTAGLKTKAPPIKWVLAGVALLMDVSG